ncbi:hypothetical protein [Chitinophaga polysaccharea]
MFARYQLRFQEDPEKFWGNRKSTNYCQYRKNTNYYQ